MSCILVRFSTNFDIHLFRLAVLLILYCCCLYMRIKRIIRIKDNKDSGTVSWGGVIISKSEELGHCPSSS